MIDPKWDSMEHRLREEMEAADAAFVGLFGHDDEAERNANLRVKALLRYQNAVRAYLYFIGSVPPFKEEDRVREQSA